MNRRDLMLIILVLSLPFIPVAYAYYRMTLHFPESKYAALLQSLLTAGYIFVLPRDLHRYMPLTTNSKIVIIFHDVDDSVGGADVFIHIEESLRIRSAFYLRPDAGYFTQDIAKFQSLQTQGWEIGYHYDALSRSNGNIAAAVVLFTAQLTYMRVFFNITTTRAHGDSYNLKIFNAQLYNSTLWHNLGISDFTAVNGATGDIRDTNGVWSDSGARGPLVVILCHTDWW